MPNKTKHTISRRSLLKLIITAPIVVVLPQRLSAEAGETVKAEPFAQRCVLVTSKKLDRVLWKDIKPGILTLLNETGQAHKQGLISIKPPNAPEGVTTKQFQVSGIHMRYTEAYDIGADRMNGRIDTLWAKPIL